MTPQAPQSWHSREMPSVRAVDVAAAAFEKTAPEEGERRVWALSAAIILSAAVHAILLYALSDCAFMPVSGAVRADRKWTKDVPAMRVSRLAGDPLAAEMNAEGRPVAAPVEERTEDRVDRLAEIPVASPVANLQSEAGPLPQAEAPIPEPARWSPGKDVAEIAVPEAPYDASDAPRRISADAPAAPAIPAPSIPGELLNRASAPAQVKIDSAVSSGSSATPVPPPVPVGPLGFGGTGSKDGFGLGAFADVVKAADEAVRDADRREEAAQPAVAEAKKAEAPAPAAVAETVDEKTVTAAKEAVRTLRDTQAGEPFEKFVTTDLAHWTDPQRPQFKYFRIRVSSNERNPLPVVAKDVIYLLDASGSIANDRLRACRKAVSEELRRLNSNDRFNIVAFRDKFTYAFPAWQEVDAYSVQQADQWLGRLTAHGRTDVFATLRSVMAVPRNPSRPMTALVITDGEATSGMTRSAEIISAFSELNGGLVSIYMYGVKEKANAYLMDMLARGNRGGWTRHSGLRWTAASGIPELAGKFADPVLADVSVTFAAASRVEAYPRLVTTLCRGEPIEIWGVCPASNSEVVFSLRGLNGSKVYESVFRLEFDPAKKLTADARTSWAQMRLYALVEDYSENPSASLMRDLRVFASEHGLAVPYEDELKR